MFYLGWGAGELGSFYLRHLLGQAQHLVPWPLGSTAVLVHIILKWFTIAIHVLYKYLLHSKFVL